MPARETGARTGRGLRNVVQGCRVELSRPFSGFWSRRVVLGETAPLRPPPGTHGGHRELPFGVPRRKIENVRIKRRSRLLTAALFSVVLSLTFCASGANADMACAGDALRFCAADIPDQMRTKSCLLRNIRNLSLECRAQFREGRVRYYPVPHKD